MSRCGADEFYAGIMPPEWVEKFSSAISTNRRGPSTANFGTVPELREAVQIAHGLGKEVFVAFNSPYYTSEQVDVLMPLARDLVDDVRPDGLIVSDIGLMLAFIEKGFDKPIVVSTLAIAHNVQSIEFFREIGAKRVILPRQLSVAEIESIRSKVPDMEIEAFILNDTCVYQEGHCHTQHNIPYMENFCFTPWDYETLSNDGLRPVGSAEEEKWQGHLKDYREWLWYCRNCGFSMTLRGLVNGACGLCAIHRLARAGVNVLKIVGREAPLDRKAKSVIVVRTIVDMVLEGMSEEDVNYEARKLRDTPEFCDSGYLCYYRDASTGLKGSTHAPDPGRENGASD